MKRRSPRTTRTYTRFPYTTLFRSAVAMLGAEVLHQFVGVAIAGEIVFGQADFLAVVEMRLVHRIGRIGCNARHVVGRRREIAGVIGLWIKVEGMLETLDRKSDV